MKQNQIFIALFPIGILMALTGAMLMFFRIGPLQLRIIIGFIGLCLISTSSKSAKTNKT
jgi:hypothetical protein